MALIHMVSAHLVMIARPNTGLEVVHAGRQIYLRFQAWDHIWVRSTVLVDAMRRAEPRVVSGCLLRPQVCQSIVFDLGGSERGG